MGERDEVRSLKQNVLVGRLVPADIGLTFRQSRKVNETTDEPDRYAIAMQGGDELAAALLAAAFFESSVDKRCTRIESKRASIDFSLCGRRLERQHVVRLCRTTNGRSTTSNE